MIIECSIFFLIWFMINKDTNNYIDLLPRNFPLSILVVVHISSKVCMVIIIYSKTVIGKSTVKKMAVAYISLGCC